jgi:hypothetical protein
VGEGHGFDPQKIRKVLDVGRFKATFDIVQVPFGAFEESVPWLKM